MDINYDQVFNQSIQRDIKNPIPNLFKEETLTYHGSVYVFSIKSSSNRKRMPMYTRCSPMPISDLAKISELKTQLPNIMLTAEKKKK
jgi:hypothetical protein